MIAVVIFGRVERFEDAGGGVEVAVVDEPNEASVASARRRQETSSEYEECCLFAGVSLQRTFRWSST